jgi:hypothetical protein
VIEDDRVCPICGASLAGRRRQTRTRSDSCRREASRLRRTPERFAYAAKGQIGGMDDLERGQPDPESVKRRLVVLIRRQLEVAARHAHAVRLRKRTQNELAYRRAVQPREWVVRPHARDRESPANVRDCG